MTSTKLILGCGYLGGRVAAAWMSRGDVVHAVTRSAERAALWRDAGLQPIVADVCDDVTLRDLPEVDTVLYAVGYDRSSGWTQREVAVDGLRHVLERMQRRCRRLVFISSSSVYGQSAGEWVDETSPCEPTQPGGECCLAAERLVRATISGSAANVLRLSGIYGPQRLLSRVEALRNGEPLTGNPNAWLNLIHVDDAVQAVLACEDRGVAGETYLVSGNSPVQRGEYYAHLARLVGAPPPDFEETQPAKRGSGGINKRCTNRRLRDDLRVTLRYPTFVEGLAASVDSV
ncbi:MAG TPA: SDR family oxidoreductase [Planctomycetaceae bacterium]|nr:SDR family oxidoreductase [Planctomycetaceae bacterium]